MKHLTALLLITFALLSGISVAQVVVKANPGGLALGAGSASVEWFASSRISAQLDGYWMPGTTRNSLTFSGAGVGVSGRYYATSSDRPTGLFISPMLAQHWIYFDDLRSVPYQYNFTSLGGQLGYQYTLKRIVTLEIGAGIWSGLNVPTIKQAFGSPDYYGKGLNVWLNAGLGIVLWSK